MSNETTGTGGSWFFDESKYPDDISPGLKREEERLREELLGQKLDEEFKEILSRRIYAKIKKTKDS